MKYAQSMIHPEELTCPDGSRTKLTSWRCILAGVADWLVSKDYINKSHYPMLIGPNDAILGQYTRTTDSFNLSREWVICMSKLQPGGRYMSPIKLVGIAGLNPSDFVLSFGDSVRPSRLHT